MTKNLSPLLRYTLLFLIFSLTARAQEKLPFWNEIQAFKKQDSVQRPPANAILFVGSSSFNYWKDVQQYFPGYPIINRGFGGSTLKDVIRYAGDIIYPYKPKQVVVYCGENDFAESDTVSVGTVVSRLKTLYKMTRDHLGNVSFVYVSIKPSPSRRHLMPKMVEANKLIREFLAKEKKTGFVDVYHKMLDSHGEPIKEIFRADSLHMKKEGYAIWKKAIKPYLVK